MSYDVHLETQKSEECPLCHRYDPDQTFGDWNETSNTHQIWNRALGFEFKLLEGKAAIDCIPHLQRAVFVLEDPNNREEFERMNPPNGWGTYQTATRFLKEILAGCREHPEAFVKMSY